MINILKQDLRSTREDPRDQVKSKHEDWNQAVCEIAKKRAHCGDRTLDRMLDKRSGTVTGCWVETRQTGDRTRGPDADGNRPDAGTQRPIEYSKVPERHIYDRTHLVAGNRTLDNVRSVFCRFNGQDDRTRPVRMIQHPVSSSFAGVRPQRLLSQWGL